MCERVIEKRESESECKREREKERECKKSEFANKLNVNGLSFGNRNTYRSAIIYKLNKIEIVL